MSKILCVLDGMNDPFFDAEAYPALASFPERGHVKTVPDGFEPETLPCILSLLGIGAPRNARGWIEALGAGIPVGPDDLIFRGSWVSLNGDGVCGGFCNAPERVVQPEGIRYIPLGGYQSLLVVPGYAFAVNAARAALPFDLFGKRAAEQSCPPIPPLKDALKLINGTDPGRVMIPWAPSVAQTMPNLPQKAAAVCGAPVAKGVARALRLQLVTSKRMTGNPHTDLYEKCRAALELAKEYPLVLLHIGGCDEAAHRLDRKGKEAFLRKIDQIVLRPLLLSPHTIEAASDHGADPETGRHTGGEQPFFRRPKPGETHA